MIQYKLISDNIGFTPLTKNNIYDGNFIPNGWQITVARAAQEFPDEWEILYDDLPNVEIPKIKFLKDEIQVNF